MKKTSPEVCEQIIADYLAIKKSTHESIGRMYGVSDTTVGNILRAAGVKGKERKIPSSRQRELYDAYFSEEKPTLTAVAREFELKIDTAGYWIRALGGVIDKSRGHKKMKPKEGEKERKCDACECLLDELLGEFDIPTPPDEARCADCKERYGTGPLPREITQTIKQNLMIDRRERDVKS